MSAPLLMPPGFPAMISRTLATRAYPNVGPLDFFFDGADRSAGFADVSGNKRLNSIANRGTAGPARWLANTAPIPLTTRGAGSRRAPLHTASPGAIQGTNVTGARLHMSGTVGELWLAFYVDSDTAAIRQVFGTTNSTVNRGARLIVTAADALQFLVGDGSGAATLTLTLLATLTAPSYHVVRIAKNGTGYSADLDGVNVTSGTASALSATATSNNVAAIGSISTAGSNLLPGSVCMALGTQRLLSGGEATAMSAAINARWAP